MAACQEREGILRCLLGTGRCAGGDGAAEEAGGGGGEVEDTRADGVTFLDAVWGNAPFANQGQFVSTVTRTAEEWVAAGLMTSAQKDTVVSTATRARLPG